MRSGPTKAIERRSRNFKLDESVKKYFIHLAREFFGEFNDNVFLEKINSLKQRLGQRKFSQTSKFNSIAAELQSN